jgi:ABC-type ATPase involved in cell division
MSEAPPHIEMHGVTKAYHGLRPLRIARLQVRAGDQLTLSGFDAAAAEVFIHLVTGAAVPDEGDVRVAGHNTRDIATDTEWLQSLDRFGIVTERAVLLDGISTEANLALPLTLAIDPMSDETRTKVAAVAKLAGLAADRLNTTVATLTPEERARVHLGRAIANAPAVLLLEHPTARLDPSAAEAFGNTLARIAATEGLTWVALSEDEAFARGAGGRRLRLKAATGELAEPGLWRRVFG